MNAFEIILRAHANILEARHHSPHTLFPSTALMQTNRFSSQ
jgi:hypothetical protein